MSRGRGASSEPPAIARPSQSGPVAGPAPPADFVGAYACTAPGFAGNVSARPDGVLTFTPTEAAPGIPPMVLTASPAALGQPDAFLIWEDRVAAPTLPCSFYFSGNPPAPHTYVVFERDPRTRAVTGFTMPYYYPLAGAFEARWMRA